MKNILFTEEERKLLVPLCLYRLSEIPEEFKTPYKTSLRSAMEKMSASLQVTYKEWEAIMCVSCVNEHIASFRKALDIPDLYSWLNPSNEQKEAMNRIDNSLDILYKCGKHRKNEDFEYAPFRYRHVLNAIDQMKQTDVVCLSWSGQADFDRIAFVSPEKKAAVFMLQLPLDPKDILFSSSNYPLPKKYYCVQFTEVMSRQKARQLLSTCKKEDYPAGVIDFFDSVLN